MLALEAAGVQEFYDVLFEHWEAPLKDLHVLRMERAKRLTHAEPLMIQIEDDDHDLEDLEKKSLEQAQKGIVVPGVIVIGDDDGMDDAGLQEPSVADLPKPSNPTAMETSVPNMDEAAHKIAMIKQLNCYIARFHFFLNFKVLSKCSAKYHFPLLVALVPKASS